MVKVVFCLPDTAHMHAKRSFLLLLTDLTWLGWALPLLLI